MKPISIILNFSLLFFLLSCNINIKKKETVTEIISTDKDSLAYRPSAENYTLKDTTVLFLWRELIPDESGHKYESMVVNEKFIKIMPEPVKAAIAYSSTFVGNECWWENGEANEDRTNLKCKILTALNLGCQGSKTHLDFLRYWFRTDKKSLERLESVPTVPYTATIQDWFEKIHVIVKDNIIKVSYFAEGVNYSESETWRWKETDIYEYKNNTLKLVDVESTGLK